MRLGNRIRKWQATSIEYIMRRAGLEHLISTGKLEGMQGTGRQRKKIMDCPVASLNTHKVTSVMLAAKDRVTLENHD